MENNLWFCGRGFQGETKVNFRGIFSSKEKAIKACKYLMDFICLIKVDDNKLEGDDEHYLFCEPYYPLSKENDFYGSPVINN